MGLDGEKDFEKDFSPEAGENYRQPPKQSDSVLRNTSFGLCERLMPTPWLWISIMRGQIERMGTP